MSAHSPALCGTLILPQGYTLALLAARLDLFIRLI